MDQPTMRNDPELKNPQVAADSMQILTQTISSPPPFHSSSSLYNTIEVQERVLIGNLWIQVRTFRWNQSVSSDRFFFFPLFIYFLFFKVPIYLGRCKINYSY
jgi:hypothetical protein